MRRKKTLPRRIMAAAELSIGFALALFAMQKRRLKSKCLEKLFGHSTKAMGSLCSVARFFCVFCFFSGTPGASERPPLPARPGRAAPASAEPALARDFASPRPIALGGRWANGRKADAPSVYLRSRRGLARGRPLGASARLAADSPRFGLGRGGNGGGRFRCALKRKRMEREGNKNKKRPEPGSGRLRVAGGQAPPPLWTVGVTLLRPLRLRPRRRNRRRRLPRRRAARPFRRPPPRRSRTRRCARSRPRSPLRPD